MKLFEKIIFIIALMFTFCCLLVLFGAFADILVVFLDEIGYSDTQIIICGIALFWIGSIMSFLPISIISKAFWEKDKGEEE